MSTKPICLNHHLEAVVKQGLKKRGTNTVIPPFFSCPWRGPNNEYCDYRFPNKPGPEDLFEAGLSKMTKDDQEIKRSKDIKWMNALNNATLLVAHGIMPVEADWEPQLRSLADSIYAMKSPEERGPTTATTPSRASSTPF